MRTPNPGQGTKEIFCAWALIYLCYIIFASWIASGPGALDGTPGDRMEILVAAIRVACAFLQLRLAIVLRKAYTPRLFWLTAASALLCIGSFFLVL